MVRHILVSHCPEGIEGADCMVRFLREFARSLHLPKRIEMMNEPLTSSGPWYRGVSALSPWGFGEKW